MFIVGTLLGLELLLFGFFFAGKGRGRVFDKNFMEKHFLEEHNLATGEKSISKSGLPDMGCGRYSAKLSYKQWYEFNNAQRAHYNFL